MAWKAESYPAVPEPGRRFLVREVPGFLQFVLAAALFLALLANRLGERWTGDSGDWVARGLAFALGTHIPFILPAMGAAAAWNIAFGRGPLLRRGSLAMRLGGGFLLVTAVCGLLATHASLGDDATDADVFRAGGILGSFLIAPEGMNLVGVLGRLGALVSFFTASLLGLVLFTETLVREAGGAALRVVSVLALPSTYLEPLGRLTAPIRETFHRAVALPGDAVRGLLGAPSPDRPRRDARGLPGPILELPPGACDVERPPEAWAEVQPARWEPGRRETRATLEHARRDMEARSVATERERPPRAERSAARAPDRAADRPTDRAPERTPDRPVERAEEPAPPAPPPADRSAASRLEALAQSSNRVFRAFGSRPAQEAPPPPPVPPVRPEKQPEFDFVPRPSGGGIPHAYELPPMGILAPPPRTSYRMSDAERDELSRKIEATLRQFRVEVEVVEVLQGPTITRFALQIAPGIRVSKILALENDLALALRATQVRVLAPIPGQAAVGIEVPNRGSEGVFLRELLETDEFRNSRSPLSFALGKNIAGEPVVADLAQMPHLLIAGATGAGKSVCLNTIIASLLYRNSPDKVKLVLVDPKRVELSVYQAIPHLLSPVVVDPRKAASALEWTVEQMEARYKLLADVGVRNIDGYNAVVLDRQPNRKAMGRDLKYMPHIVVVIDELADLMMVAKNEVEGSIIRLAQMARAVGIHLILATQRPSVNVITGIIKANFPSRIAFRVSSKIDSRTILDMNGAQSLLGRGDMLFQPGGGKPFRIQGAFVSDDEIERLADHVRAQEKARYEKEDFDDLRADPRRAGRGRGPAEVPGARAVAMEDSDESYPQGDVEDEDVAYARPAFAARASSPVGPADMESLSDDALYEVALRLVLESRKASVSYIQRRLKIGYARAGRVMDMMEERGIVGPYQGSRPRDLAVDPEEFLRRWDEADDCDAV